MVLSIGRRCIRPRLLPRRTPTPTTAAQFTTTTSRFAGVKAQKAQSGPRRAQSLGIKRAMPEERRTYDNAERKKLRDTIVLQNANAPVIDLHELTKEISTHEAAVGSVFTFGSRDIDRLRVLGGFQRNQDWKYFHKPSTVYRSESLQVGEMMRQVEGYRAEDGENVEGKMKRVIFEGPKGSGKSVLLLQSMAWALQKGWLVVNIPNARDLVIGHTEYEFDLSTNLWAQPEYTRTLLTRVNRANDEVLANITLAKARKIGRDEFPEGAPISQLIEAGGRDSNVSHEAFLSFLDELTIAEGRTTALPPVLFALDNFGQISLLSKYRDPDYKCIHAHELGIPNAFISFLNGTRKFRRGFAVAATSSASPRAEALGFALRGEPLPDYSKLDTRIHDSVQGAEVLRVGEMQKEEARSLLDYCRRTGLLRGDVDDEVLAQRYALSSGIAREIVKGCVRVTA